MPVIPYTAQIQADGQFEIDAFEGQTLSATESFVHFVTLN